MPLIGFFLGSLFADIIVAIDHWVAFALLALIGVNMLKEAFSMKCECDEQNADLSVLSIQNAPAFFRRRGIRLFMELLSVQPHRAFLCKLRLEMHDTQITVFSQT